MLELDDQVLELDLTPNRSDCLSMIGVAYEIGALLDREVRLPEADIADRETAEVRAADQFTVYDCGAGALLALRGPADRGRARRRLPRCGCKTG